MPTLRDRVAPRALKLVSEPIFAADFVECAYGFRPKRDAHQAVGAMREARSSGHPSVLDADLQPYFDTSPHAKLLAGIARRGSERHSLRWIKPWLKATVVEEDGEGKRHSTGGKMAKRGTPQGGVITPLTQ